MLGVLLILAFLAVRADSAEKPTVVPELAGGNAKAAVFADNGFFDAAHRCLDRYPFSKFQADAGAHQQDCLADYMEDHKATPQAIAFMLAAPVPAAVSAVRDYNVAVVVHAAMMWADGSDGWAIVGRSGELVPLWTPPALDDDPTYREFQRLFPGTSLWGDRLAWPRREATESGGLGLAFTFTLKTCHACKRLGIAHVIYSFDRDGRFRGTRLQRIATGRGNP